MKINKDEVIKQLKTVVDPELHINIVDLGLIYNIKINNEIGEVEIRMTLTTPGCPLSHFFDQWIPEAVAKVDGVKNTRIDLVWEPAWDPDKISDDSKEELGMIK